MHHCRTLFECRQHGFEYGLVDTVRIVGGLDHQRQLRRHQHRAAHACRPVPAEVPHDSPHPREWPTSVTSQVEFVEQACQIVGQQIHWSTVGVGARVTVPAPVVAHAAEACAPTAQRHATVLALSPQNA